MLLWHSSRLAPAVPSSSNSLGLTRTPAIASSVLHYLVPRPRIHDDATAAPRRGTVLHAREGDRSSHRERTLTSPPRESRRASPATAPSKTAPSCSASSAVARRAEYSATGVGAPRSHPRAMTDPVHR